ncbi:MAG: A/G-specific adenine glycosylase [Prevotella sp.]|nr:A/G-specific adenine glycosylase [Prevotella sp.]
MSNHPFTITILRWFSENRRNLPWRETTDPYAIWLSEIILQQTRIQQGTAYWERFMQKFPTVESLASASEDEVLRLWQGLGYYSRARNLHAAAKQIVEAGAFPDTLEGIKRLKGVGDYTAAAIGSIAFGIPAAAVDGNVYRVLARHFGMDTPINTTEGKKIFTSLAQELLPKDEASAFNQALMDFGALQCTPSSPRCVSCPLTETCEALRTGKVEQLPVKKRTLKIQTRRLTYIYIRCKGQTAIHRRAAGDIWQGLWEPVNLEHTQLSVPEGELRLVQQNVKHVLTHRILLADCYLWETIERPSLPKEYIWVDEESLDSYALPRLIERLIPLCRSQVLP